MLVVLITGAVGILDVVDRSLTDHTTARTVLLVIVYMSAEMHQWVYHNPIQFLSKARYWRHILSLCSLHLFVTVLMVWVSEPTWIVLIALVSVTLRAYMQFRLRQPGPKSLLVAGLYSVIMVASAVLNFRAFRGALDQTDYRIETTFRSGGFQESLILFGTQFAAINILLRVVAPMIAGIERASFLEDQLPRLTKIIYMHFSLPTFVVMFMIVPIPILLVWRASITLIDVVEMLIDRKAWVCVQRCLARLRGVPVPLRVRYGQRDATMLPPRTKAQLIQSTNKHWVSPVALFSAWVLARMTAMAQHAPVEWLARLLVAGGADIVAIATLALVIPHKLAATPPSAWELAGLTWEAVGTAALLLAVRRDLWI